tara:strand:- start:3827 stop:4546 length:720 start_codon:yes stop_codon:yes gene_type:complete
MSLLTMIERATRRLGIPVPSTVVGNTDAQVVQLLEIANQEGEELAARKSDWEVMTLENTFTFTAAADQGLLNSAVVSDGDFDYIINDTFWNRTTSLPVLGSLNAIDWQTLQAFPVTGPYEQYRIRSGKLFIDPAPSSTDTGAFEYHSTSWCEDNVAVGQALWAADDDVGRLDETLMILGIIWRWKQVKGLDYAEEFKLYETRVLDAIARDGGAPRLALNGGIRHRLPGVMVPLGSWSVS